MNIAVIAHAHYAIRQPFVGGLEAHTYNMVQELVRQGHNVTTYAKAGTNVPGNNIPIFHGNAYEGRHPLYDHGYRRAMHHITIHQYDLIINNSLNTYPLILHDETMAPMLTVFHTPAVLKRVAVMRRQYVQANRAYIAVSDITAQDWQKVCADTIHVVDNGMELAGWSYRTATAIKPEKPTAAWVGWITPEKGTHLAIEACISMGLPLTLGGNIYDKKYFERTIRPYLKNPLITYVGHADHAQVNDIYKQADVALITPVWNEPFGLVAIEALASGTPVAALANGALPSIITSEVGALSDTDTPVGLASAIELALTKDRAACRRHVEEHYTLAAMVERYLALAPRYEPALTADMTWQTSL